MDDFNNYNSFNSGNNPPPNVRLNPYTGEPMPYNPGNQGSGNSQNYNQTQQPGNPYSGNPQSRNPYSGDPIQAQSYYRDNYSRQNNFQSRGNIPEPRYNSYGRAQNKQMSGCGCFLAVFIFLIVVVVSGSLVVYRYLEKNLDLEELTSTSSSYSTDDKTTSTEEEPTEAADVTYPDLATSDGDYHGLSSDDPATTMDEVVETFIYLIKSGVEDSATIYISGLTTDDLITINSYPDFIKYAVSDRHSTTLLGDSGTVTYTFKVNDTYYVERYYLEGVSIPDDKSEAKALYDAVEEFNSNYITSDMTAYDKELAIHDFLVDTVTYGNQTVIIDNEHEAYGALIEHSAVCEGYAKAFQLLCTVNGIECKYITGETDEAHGWNLVNLNGVWYHVDVTWDDPVDTSGTGENTFDGYVSHAYFNVSDDILAQDGHSWERSNYPTANSMAMNYYTVNGTLVNDYDTFSSTLAANAYSGNLAEIAIMDYDESTYDIVGVISNTSYYGGYSWAFSRDLSHGFQVLVIAFD